MDLARDDPADDALDGLGRAESGAERLAPRERREALGREGRLARGRGEATPEREGDGLAPLGERVHGLARPVEGARQAERVADLVEGVRAAHPEAAREPKGGTEGVESVGCGVLGQDGGAEVGARAEVIERGGDEPGAEDSRQSVGGSSAKTSRAAPAR